jgi:enterochelin esterase-like enzyme/acetyl esterase/lipase
MRGIPMSRRSFARLSGLAALVGMGAVGGVGLTGCAQGTSTSSASSAESSGASGSSAGDTAATGTDAAGAASGYDAGQIPEELEYVPDGYTEASDHPGTLERLDYQTYESFSYAEKSQTLQKTAWVYVPYGYSDQQQYDILYLSHGGWSNETSLMGTPGNETFFKNIIDHAIDDGLIEPLLIVLPTYNNTSGDDSGDYELALQLTNNFHNELVGDLMPAAESRYRTYAESTTPEGFEASRDHRGFAGFSMGSVNTWHTFQYCLDYFRWFMPMSGALTSDGSAMAQMVTDQGRTAQDFFIYSMSGSEDFAESSIKTQIDAMVDDGASGGAEMFVQTDTLDGGNIAYRERAGYRHDANSAAEYTYNGMRLFFNGPRHQTEGGGTTAAIAASGVAASDIQPRAWYTQDTPVDEVINDSALSTDGTNWGRLIFPVDQGYMSGSTLGSVRLTWYSEIDPAMTVDICNYLRERAERGERVFFPIYSDDEIAADPDKADTGLFFFEGQAGGRAGFCCAGGGFAYVGAIHDSFPHALTLARKGYNAFAIIYRPDSELACEDLSRGIALVRDHAADLGTSLDGYSIWGGSAGARMADWVGTYGTETFTGDACPRPSAIVMQYTGLSEVTGSEPPTYACVGTYDGIANWQTMQRRIQTIQANGTPAEIEVFDGLSHGFGLGTGTVAEGWIDRAVDFWDQQS